MKLLTEDQIEFIKEKWVPALMSGEYKQGKEYLHFDDKYCCLGVGCIVEGMKPNEIWGLDLPFEEWGTKTRQIFDALDTYPEPIISTTPTNKLSSLNDDQGYDFAAIANFLLIACEVEVEAPE